MNTKNTSKNIENNLVKDVDFNGTVKEVKSPSDGAKPLGMNQPKLGPNDSERSFNVGNDRITIVENSQRSFAITTGDALNLAYGVKPCEDYEIQNVIRDL